MGQDRIVDEIQRQQAPKTDALELAITLTKVDRLCHDVLTDDHDPVSHETQQFLVMIKRMINHRDLAEAKALLRLRDRVKALAKAYEGSSWEFLDDDLYVELANIFEEEAQ